MKRSLAATIITLTLLITPASAKTLRIGLAEDPDTLDPTLSRTLVARIVFAAMCDKLFDLGPNLEIVPQLATSYSWSDDNKALTLHLRENVKFQNGEPFDASAVKFSLERHLTLPGTNRKGEIGAITAVSAVDGHTVRLELSTPSAPLLSQLADRAGMMVAPKAAAAAGDKFAQSPVCVGPFKFKERVAQDRIVLERDQGYWDKDHFALDEVVYRPLPDTPVRLANLQSGDLDMIERVAATDMAALRRDKRFATASAPELGWTGIIFNIANGAGAAQPLAQQKRLREAFELTLDRTAINQVVFEGDFIPGNQFVPPSSPYFVANFPPPARDVAKAKHILAELGQPHVAVELTVFNNPDQRRVAEVIQSMASEAGFDVKIVAQEVTAALRAQDHGDFVAGLTFWSGRADPDGNISIWASCKGALNGGKYCNPTLEALLDRARQTLETTERKRLYAEAMALLLDERPFIWLFHRRWDWAFTGKLEGFKPQPDGLIRLSDVSLR
jgi:peptide/nickel transport system substrate-binding protein